jgi:hypothetical protein
MHAMNAVLGRPHFTWPSFIAMTAAFDAVAGLPRGTSAAVYAATDNLTLFQFAMAPLDTRRVVPVPTHKKNAEQLAHLRTAGLAAFVFNTGHAWALQKLQSGAWVKVDSLSGVSATTLDAHWTDGIGLEVLVE